MKEYLESLAKEEGCELLIGNEKISTGRGSFVEESTYQLEITHKRTKILVNCTFGAHAMATIYAYLEPLSDGTKFSITTKSHFNTLFNRKKDRIVITCKDQHLTKFLKENHALNDLREICKTAEFDPYITGENEKNNFILRTNFHLLFPERELVMKPIIKLHKDFIDRTL